jgi:hypothetical protein
MWSSVTGFPKYHDARPWVDDAARRALRESEDRRLAKSDGLTS